LDANTTPTEEKATEKVAKKTFRHRKNQTPGWAVKKAPRSVKGEKNKKIRVPGGTPVEEGVDTEDSLAQTERCVLCEETGGGVDPTLLKSQAETRTTGEKNVF